MTNIKQDIAAMVPILSVSAISAATGMYAAQRFYREEIYALRQSDALMEQICIEETGRRDKPWVWEPFLTPETLQKNGEKSND